MAKVSIKNTNIKNKRKSKNSKNKEKAKYDDMRQIDWSYFGPGYWN